MPVITVSLPTVHSKPSGISNSSTVYLIFSSSRFSFPGWYTGRFLNSPVHLPLFNNIGSILLPDASRASLPSAFNLILTLKKSVSLYSPPFSSCHFFDTWMDITGIFLFVITISVAPFTLPPSPTVKVLGSAFLYPSGADTSDNVYLPG